jgi:hypothetical protein
MRANLPANTPTLRQRCRVITCPAGRDATGVRIAVRAFEVVSSVRVIRGGRSDVTAAVKSSP